MNVNKTEMCHSTECKQSIVYKYATYNTAVVFQSVADIAKSHNTAPTMYSGIATYHDGHDRGACMSQGPQ